jgi:hypothetical protein
MQGHPPLARFVEAGNGLFRRVWLEPKGATLALDEAPPDAGTPGSVPLGAHNFKVIAAFLKGKLSPGEYAGFLDFLRAQGLVPDPSDDMPDKDAGAREQSDMPAQDARPRQSPSQKVDTMSTAVAELNAYRIAERECAPVLGPPGMAMDSSITCANDLYGAALKRMGIATTGINAAAFADIYRAHLASRRNSGRPLLARDSAAETSFYEMFPEARRIKNLG